jgi:F-type H+-transporting ATPase subunit delta
LSSKSTFSNSTAKSYAVALYDLSKESSELDAVINEAKSLQELLKINSEFKEIISNPIVSKEDKGNIVFLISKNNNFSETFRKFLGYAADRNRLFFLEKIIESFLNLVSKNKGELQAKLISSKRLSDEELKKIEKELSNDFKSKLDIKYKYDPDLIAGLIVQVGSVMVDTTIKTKLKKLKQSMVEA